MSVAAVSSTQTAHVSAERAEGPRRDHDGDSDDSAVKAPVQAAPAPGTGTVINIKA
jgi:hypothetical protein